MKHTIKEILAKATPGEWSSVYIGSGDWMVHTADKSAEVHFGGSVGREQSEANNELSARCNPVVMSKVVEALEYALVHAPEGTDLESDLKDALALLNGGTP